MAKRKNIPKKINNVSYNQLYRETQKLIEETNRRLKKLEKGTDINKAKYNPKTKRFERKNTYTVISDTGKRIKVKPTNIVKYSSDSWASKKLQTKLSQIKGVNPRDIKITKNMNYSSLKAIHKATKDFLRSKTSTIKGIKDVESNIKNTISDVVEDIPDITNDDINTLYNFFEDKDFNDVTQYVDPSSLWVLLSESKANDLDTNDFISQMGMYIDSDSLYKDQDLVDKLRRIYDKFN